MFCGNCGAKIDDDAMFCPSCGLPIGQKEVKKVQVKKKSKKPLIIIGIAAIAVMVVFVGLKIFGYYKSRPTEQQMREAVNNYQNGGLVTTDGKWVYYNDQGLCKIRLKDGKKQSVVSSDIMPEKMFCIGDSIYYYNVMDYYKTKISKPEEIRLDVSVFAKDCFQTDGKNYYVSGGGITGIGSGTSGIYSAKASNVDKNKLISDIHATQLLMYKDYLYVFSNFNTINNEPNENFGTWRINKDGSDKIDLLGFCPRYMVFCGDTIYYTDEDGTICSMKLDGSKQTTYEGRQTREGLNITEDYVFYIDYSQDGNVKTIHRMDWDGSGEIELNQDASSDICIVGDWIYYENLYDDYDIYRMSFDGVVNEAIY